MDLGLGTLISGGIGAIGNLISGISSGKKSLQAVQETNQANRELAEYQYEKNLEMWERQNVYNSPIEQMNRLKEAGLNPNLMYGQGTTGNASDSPKYQAPDMQAYTGFGDFGVGRASQDLMNGLMGYANIKKTNAEADNIRQNTQNLEVQKSLTELQVIQQGILNAKGDKELSVWLDLYRSKIASNDSTAVNNLAHADLAKSQRDYTDKQRERFELLTPLVQQQTETALKQALFDLYHLSPAKLNNVISNTAVQNAAAKLSNLQSEALFNEIEFGEKSPGWNMYKREYDSIMMEFEKAIGDELQRNGVNLKSNQWFVPVFHNIEKYIALPLGEALDKLF